MSGAVYPMNNDLNELLIQIQKMTLWSNPLHMDAFPAVRRMEAEVVRMCLTMFNGDADSCGTMTSGGTESLMLACLAYRNLAYKQGIKRPEMVIPSSAHAAFDKVQLPIFLFTCYLRFEALDFNIFELTRHHQVKSVVAHINHHTLH
uniref:Aspartate aminotransferase family protein n=1 Tax=Mesocestoides corti TaxID=53468 RepID=A0A5K3FX38_MESCO